MDTIDRHDLQQLLATGQPVRLVMVLGPRRFVGGLEGWEAAGLPLAMTSGHEPVAA
jgi:hypothetical protein